MASNDMPSPLNADLTLETSPGGVTRLTVEIPLVLDPPPQESTS